MTAPPTTDRPPAGARRPAFAHPWRIVTVVVALLIVINLAVILLRNTDTSSTTNGGLPTIIESVSPGNGEIVRTTDTISVDLNDVYTGVIAIDRAEVPEDQIERVGPLGQISFRPGAGKDLEQFSPGIHTVTVSYWPQAKDRPARPATYTWTFKATV